MTKPHVLIATDLSENSHVPEEAGAALARQLGAKVSLVNCFDPAPAVPPMAIPNTARMEAAIEREMADAIEKRLREIQKERLASVDDVDVKALRGASAPGTLCDYAAKHGVDWIVVGTHGRTGLRHMLIGSVAERVVRHAPCSVIVAR